MSYLGPDPALAGDHWCPGCHEELVEVGTYCPRCQRRVDATFTRLGIPRPAFYGGGVVPAPAPRRARAQRRSVSKGGA